MSFPLPPAPITWASDQAVTAPALRADCTNLAWLLTKRPILAASQQSAAQALTSSATTPVTLDTEYADNWNGHTLLTAPYDAQLAGWYLAEGTAFIGGTNTTANYGAGIQAIQNFVTSTLFGNFITGNGANNTCPAASDLVQLNPFTADSVALVAFQASGGSLNLATPGAYYSTEWVALPTSLPGGEGNINGTVVSSPQPAALWPPGSGTLITNGGGISAGATSMTVGSTTGMVVGGSLGLDFYEGTAVSPMAETVTITSIASLTIGISATVYPHGGTTTPGYVAIPVSAAFMNQQVRDVINFLAYPPICRVTNSGSTQSIPSGTIPAATAVTLGHTTVDNFSGWDGTSKYTFPQSGVYYVYGQVFYQALIANNISAGIGISGGTVQWGDSARSQTSLETCVTVRKTVRVTAGQYVQLFASQNSGGAVTVEVASNGYSTLIVLFRGF